MIKYEEVEVTNLFTEGFSLSLPSAMSIAIASGILSHERASGNTVYEFPAIEFDVEGDAELSVQYDVYLLSSEDSTGMKVHVDRTELGFDEFPFYTGDGEPIHTLLGFVVPPGVSDLNEVEFAVRTLALAPQEEGDTDETTTPE